MQIHFHFHHHHHHHHRPSIIIQIYVYNQRMCKLPTRKSYQQHLVNKIVTSPLSGKNGQLPIAMFIALSLSAVITYDLSECPARMAPRFKSASKRSRSPAENRNVQSQPRRRNVRHGNPRGDKNKEVGGTKCSKNSTSSIFN